MKRFLVGVHRIYFFKQEKTSGFIQRLVGKKSIQRLNTSYAKQDSFNEDTWTHVIFESWSSDTRLCRDGLDFVPVNYCWNYEICLGVSLANILVKSYAEKAGKDTGKDQSSPALKLVLLCLPEEEVLCFWNFVLSISEQYVWRYQVIQSRSAQEWCILAINQEGWPAVLYRLQSGPLWAHRR